VFDDNLQLIKMTPEMLADIPVKTFNLMAEISTTAKMAKAMAAGKIKVVVVKP
jgi:hypothetical protein